MKKIIIISLSALLLGAVEPKEKVSVALKWFYQYQFAGYIMAKEKGFYERAGLDVNLIERDPKKNNIIQVIEGEANYGVANSDILLYRAENKPVKIIASFFQHSPIVFLAKKDSGIVSPYEFKDKKISYQKGLDDAVLLSLLNYAGLKKGEYTFVDMDFSYQKFLKGDMDVILAYITDQPFWLSQQGVNLNIINPLSYGIDMYGDNLFTTEFEIKNHPERVKKFVEATKEGWKYALTHKDETIAIIRAKYKKDLSYEQLKYEADKTEQLIMPSMVEVGYTSKERFIRIAELYNNTGYASSESLNRAIEGLIYNPDDEKNIFERYKWAWITLLSFSLSFTIVLAFYSRRLNHKVAEKTHELQLLNENLSKQVNEQVKNLRQKDTMLIQQSRHAAMGEMMSIIAHQWRQPLNALYVLVQDLIDAEKFDELDKEYLEKFYKNAERQIDHMTHTIDDFRNFFKPDNEICSVSLHHIVKEALNLISKQLTSQDVSVQITILSDPKILIYESEFKHVILNIVQNARDQIVASNSSDRLIEIILDSDNEYGILTISDHAGGIPKEIANTIFDPYFSTKGVKGTGIGLYMAKMIVEEHLKGKLSTYNNEDGAVFKICIPKNL